jgi:hypothetical protein
MPARRYSEITSQVQEICERYGIPYNQGPLLQQFGTVVRKIVKLTFPDPGKLSSLLPKIKAEKPGGREPVAA